MVEQGICDLTNKPIDEAVFKAWPDRRARINKKIKEVSQSRINTGSSSMLPQQHGNKIGSIMFSPY